MKELSIEQMTLICGGAVDCSDRAQSNRRRLGAVFFVCGFIGGGIGSLILAPSGAALIAADFICNG